LLGTQSRIFVHRRENPLPGFRAEADVFEGRLLRFSDLPFEDAIRSYFAGHVGATHFFKPDDIHRIVATGVSPSVSLPDLAGDTVVLGPNDILAFELVRPGEVEVGLPIGRFANPEVARAAVVARGAEVLRPGRATPDRQTWIVAVPADKRDRLMDDLGAIDYQSDLREVRETVKARLADVTVEGSTLAVRAGDSLDPAAPGGTKGAEGSGKTRTLAGLATIRTLGTVQVPADAYLIVEAELPREHFSDAAIAVVLIAFASVDLVGLAKSRPGARTSRTA
jgi:hypothetical protein